MIAVFLMLCLMILTDSVPFADRILAVGSRAVFAHTSTQLY